MLANAFLYLKQILTACEHEIRVASAQLDLSKTVATTDRDSGGLTLHSIVALLFSVLLLRLIL